MSQGVKSQLFEPTQMRNRQEGVFPVSDHGFVSHHVPDMNSKSHHNEGLMAYEKPRARSKQVKRDHLAAKLLHRVIGETPMRRSP